MFIQATAAFYKNHETLISHENNLQDKARFFICIPQTNTYAKDWIKKISLEIPGKAEIPTLAIARPQHDPQTQVSACHTPLQALSTIASSRLPPCVSFKIHHLW